MLKVVYNYPYDTALETYTEHAHSIMCLLKSCFDMPWPHPKSMYIGDYC